MLRTQTPLRQAAQSRVAFSIALLLVLSACTATDVVATDAGGYVADPGQQVAGVDWSKAKTVDVALSEYDFTPDKLQFQQGQPYRLHLTNDGWEVHDFASKPFFQAIAAAKLVDAQKTISLPHLVSIGVAPGKAKDLYFVPVRTGTYSFECNEPLHATFGMTGVAQIE
jgi:uncharacterized cupredoxin-like copper-binding protein